MKISIERICSLYFIVFLSICSLVTNTNFASEKNVPEKQKEEKNIREILKTKEDLISQLAADPADPDQLKAMLLQILEKSPDTEALNDTKIQSKTAKKTKIVKEGNHTKLKPKVDN